MQQNDERNIGEDERTIGGDDRGTPVTRESSRGGQEPPPDVNDRPDQNVAYDEVVKGRPLTPEERARAERESPLSE